MAPESRPNPDVVIKKTTDDCLLEAVATYASDRMKAIRAIRQIQSTDPFGLALAGARLILSSKDKSPGIQYVTGLVTGGSLLNDLFLKSRILPLGAAVALARKLLAIEPMLDIHLLRSAAAAMGGDLRSTETELALRLLGLVDAVSDCSRVSAYLVQFADHRDAKVRSKVALLLGKSNWNLTRIKSLLASDDARLRANAVESLWGSTQKEVLTMLWKASEDSSPRVIINAFLGLCLMNDRKAFSSLTKLADATNPILRSGVAWAMGEIGDPEFSEVLERLEQDIDANVRAMAQSSKNKLRSLPPVLSPDPLETPSLESELPVEPTAKRKLSTFVRIG
jgi:hypothetical protein